jgi:hypothetical protein
MNDRLKRNVGWEVLVIEGHAISHFTKGTSEGEAPSESGDPAWPDFSIPMKGGG